MMSCKTQVRSGLSCVVEDFSEASTPAVSFLNPLIDITGDVHEYLMDLRQDVQDLRRLKWKP